MRLTHTHTYIDTRQTSAESLLLTAPFPLRGTVSRVKLSARTASSRRIHTDGLRRVCTDNKRQTLRLIQQPNTHKLATDAQTCCHNTPLRNFPPGVQQHISVLCTPLLATVRWARSVHFVKIKNSRQFLTGFLLRDKQNVFIYLRHQLVPGTSRALFALFSAARCVSGSPVLSVLSMHAKSVKRARVVEYEKDTSGQSPGAAPCPVLRFPAFGC